MNRMQPQRSLRAGHRGGSTHSGEEEAFQARNEGAQQECFGRVGVLRGRIDGEPVYAEQSPAGAPVRCGKASIDA
jgi:hypothetical protein